MFIKNGISRRRENNFASTTHCGFTPSIIATVQLIWLIRLQYKQCQISRQKGNDPVSTWWWAISSELGCLFVTLVCLLVLCSRIIWQRWANCCLRRSVIALTCCATSSDELDTLEEFSISWSDILPGAFAMILSVLVLISMSFVSVALVFFRSWKTGQSLVFGSWFLVEFC